MKNWYKSGQNEIEYTTVLFVPITKGGTLAKEVRQREYELNKNSKIRIKIARRTTGVKSCKSITKFWTHFITGFICICFVIYQYLSISLNISQCPSISLNIPQYISIYINISQISLENHSISHNISQYLSISLT